MPVYIEIFSTSMSKYTKGLAFDIVDIIIIVISFVRFIIIVVIVTHVMALFLTIIFAI